MGTPKELTGFPVVVPCRVRWGDMDAFQHLNNTVYLRFFEEARIVYFEKSAVVTDGSAPRGVGPILGSCSCRFKAPVTYPDTVLAGIRVSAVGEDRFTMEFALYSEQLKCVAATGEGVIVSFDYDAKKKAPLPESWKRGIGSLEATVAK